MGLFSKSDGRIGVYEHPRWSFSFLETAEDGWLIRVRNIGRLGSALAFEGFTFPIREGAVTNLEFIGSNFANPGDTLDLKFSVIERGGSLSVEGGVLQLDVALHRASGHYENMDHHAVALPPLSREC